MGKKIAIANKYKSFRMWLDYNRTNYSYSQKVRDGRRRIDAT